MAETQTDEKAGFTISTSACKRYFGYLSERDKGTAMPDDCLTCEKMLDCMFSKPEGHSTSHSSTPVPLETKPEPETPKTVEETTEIIEMVDEADESEVVAEPRIINAQIEIEQEEEPTLSPEPPEPVEPEKPMTIPVMKKSDDDFIVETPGHVYNQWSGTVLISKETLDSFGKKVKEVYVQSQDGIRVKCKVYALPEVDPRMIQIPDKLKADLEIGNGDHVKVTPK